MKTPERLKPLLEDGLVDDVIRQLMSGKEATVYVVRCGDDVRCAKVYKEANQRSFRQSVDYTEGRKTKNSRQARAMEKAQNTAVSFKNKLGKAMRLMRFIDLRRRVFVCPSHITFMRACYSWSWW